MTFSAGEDQLWRFRPPFGEIRCMSMERATAMEGAGASAPGRDKVRFRDRIGLPGWTVLLLIPVFFLAGVFFVTDVVSRPIQVRGPSMYPTLHDGDRVFLLRYRFGGHPKRNDIVSFKDVTGQPDVLIKRAVAVGGDRVTFQNGRVMVNDRYVHKSSVTRVKRPFTILIPRDTIFVMGDNEAISLDSRYFGPVPVRNIEGRAYLIWWPPGHARRL